MVDFLLRRGADPDLPEALAWAQPRVWARRRGDQQIAHTLERFLRDRQASGGSTGTL